ncbi:MAG TPA: hypothetical protein PLR60_04605 [Syntrophorhabdaceae bacterium]|nr:hypothetical protein [Syntrophorhabdaceae bacterium]
MNNMEKYSDNWLPPGKKGAVCFSMDDVHPSRSTDYYEAGGDMEKGVLGHLEWLLERHPNLRVTLFTTADWREISPRPTRKVLASIPYLRDRFYLAKRWPKGTMRLDRHREFVDYLKKLPRTEIGLHGLYHCHKGPKIPIEFQGQSREEFAELLGEILSIFQSAGIDHVSGICPPGWNSPHALLEAMVDTDLRFIASARDLFTHVSADAVTNMHGMKGVSLIYPQWVHGGRLLHMPSNFSCSNPLDRAIEIIENGGLLAIKAHAVKKVFAYVSDDGLDLAYRNFIDMLLTFLEDRYGDSLCWTSMGEITSRVFESRKMT